MEELLEYQISHHTNAIVVAGTTGESACLSDEEHLRLIQFTCRIVNGRIPVIAGAGSNNTSHAQLLCKNAQNEELLEIPNVTAVRRPVEIFRSLQKSLPVIVIALISTVEMTTRLYLPLLLEQRV